MREILRTASVSLAESLAVALDAAGIDATISNQNLGSLPPVAITVAVLNDADYEAARGVLRELERPTPRIVRPTLPPARLVIIVVIGIILLLCLQIF